MRTVFALVVIVAFVPLTAANVWTTVYRCDEMTPLAAVDPNHPGVYRDIMVGTRLVIVVSSDTDGDWLGHLRLSWEDAQYAALGGRGPTEVPEVDILRYTDSCLEAAGDTASVWDFSGPEGIGLEFATSPDWGVPNHHPAVPGDWFIFDYLADQVGSCDVGLYGLFVDLYSPIEISSFTHVASRDFDGDTVVNFEDLALFARHWRAGVGADPSSRETLFDLNSDTHVGAADLALFSEYWLERTDCGDAATDPNSPSPGV